MASRATARVQIATVLVLFSLTFSLLQWFGYRQKSATWDEPIHLAAGYAALAEGDYRLEGTHPPFIRMWAALPLLFMDGVRLDAAVIDRTPPAEWHSGGTALSYGTKFLYIDNDGDRLLNAARFMIVLCGIGLGVLVFSWTYEWLGFVPAAWATAFYTISPTVLANTSLVTTDAGITCFIFGTIYFLWRTTQRYSAANLGGLIAFLRARDRDQVFGRHPRTTDCRAAGGGRPRRHLYHSAARRRADAGAGGCRGAGDLGGLRFSIRADPVGRLGPESGECAAGADGSRACAPDRVDRSPPPVAEHVHRRIPDICAIDDDHE
jgi:hypothetical protein